jgi:3-oxoacyl-[acyl-carrier-protein] synthase-3
LVVRDVRLRGVVSAVPSRRLDNADFEAQFGREGVADVVKMTGVEHRYWAENGQTASDLCFLAAQRLLARLDWAPDSVGALVFVSQTPDHRLPATACVLQHRLGLSTRCQAFDVGLGCSGYVYGLWLASLLVQGGCGRVLLLNGDISSRTIDPTDRATALLFGDAGAASALEQSDGAPPIHFVLGTDGAGARHLIISGGGGRPPAPDSRRPATLSEDHLFMDGGEVFSFTLRAVPKLVLETLADAGLERDQLDALLLHQANRFMLRHIVKKIGLPEARAPINIDRYGNTSSASIPLLMTTDIATRLTSETTRVMSVGFGVGFSWGAALMTLAPLACAETLAA